MTRFQGALAAMALSAAASGCMNVPDSVSGNTTVNGEAWYIRTTSLGSLVFDVDVFYCPPPRGEGPATCTRALMYDSRVDYVPAELPPPNAKEEPSEAATEPEP